MTINKIYGLKPNYRQPTRILFLNILSAQGLAGKDILKLCDPYIYIVVYGESSKICDFRTKVIRKTAEPEWNEEFLVRVKPEAFSMRLEAYDKNRVTRDSYLGRVQITSTDELETIDCWKLDNVQVTRAPVEPRTKNSVVSGFLYYQAAFLPEAVTSAADVQRLKADPPSPVAPSPDAPDLVPHDINSGDNGVDPALDSLHLRNVGPSRTTLSLYEDTHHTSLPLGWDQRADHCGRLYLVDHASRTLHLCPPAPTQYPETPPNEPPLSPLSILDPFNFTLPQADSSEPKLNGADPYWSASSEFKQKCEQFREKLIRPASDHGYTIDVRRSRIMQDSFDLVMNCSDIGEFRQSLHVAFDGEDAYDMGGLQREWFSVLTKEMFNPYYGLFEYSAADQYTLQVNPNSGVANDDHLRWFRFIGIVTALAIYHDKLVDAYFIRPFYKMMLRQHIALDDLASVDIEYYNSVRYILDHNPEPLCITFCIDQDIFGATKTYELIADGKNVPVTESNKHDYVKLVIDFRFIDRVKLQMDEFLSGFNEVIDLELLRTFDEQELELLMCGLREVDVDDWALNTQYRDYEAEDETIVNFWLVVRSLSNELRARLLQFATGTSRVPVGGFSDLRGPNGPQLFTVQRWGAANQLPRAHTCFNRLGLPPYATCDALRDKLLLAIQHSYAFDGVDR